MLKKVRKIVGTTSIISLPQFEYLIASNTLDSFAKTCCNKSESLDVLNMNFRDMCNALNLLFEPTANVDLSFWENKEEKLNQILTET
jgi:hypothetical protein